MTKVVKVEIIKIISGGDSQCTNVPPEGFDAETPGMGMLCYHDEDFEDGDIVSHVLYTVRDDFTFTDKMVKITNAEAEMCIDVVADYRYSSAIARGRTVAEANIAKLGESNKKLRLPK